MCNDVIRSPRPVSFEFRFCWRQRYESKIAQGILLIFGEFLFPWWLNGFVLAGVEENAWGYQITTCIIADFNILYANKMQYKLFRKLIKNSRICLKFCRKSSKRCRSDEGFKWSQLGITYLSSYSKFCVIWVKFLMNFSSLIAIKMPNECVIMQFAVFHKFRWEWEQNFRFDVPSEFYEFFKHFFNCAATWMKTCWRMFFIIRKL